MATVTIPKESELQPYAPPGKYSHAEHGARIVSAKVDTLPGKDKDGNPRTGTYLSIRAMFRAPDGNMVFAGTQAFGRHNTQMEAVASASKARRFVKQLGFNPDAFDPEDFKDLPVILEVSMREWGDEDNKRIVNDIVDIYKG